MKKNKSFLREEVITPKQLLKRRILSFSFFMLLLCFTVIGFKWVNKQPKDNGAARPLRKALSFNEKVFSGLFDSSRLVKEYPVSAAAKKVRFNGSDGLRSPVNSGTWRLQVVRSQGDTLKISLDELKALPKKEIVFDFKCIEGWSQITHWAGVPLKTFLQHYHLNSQMQMKYIGMQTPDKGYYVGIDMPSALHPQTLLCYELNGHILPLNEGFPLRLIIPVKYGIKHLKRIGTLFFSNEKPPDFWAERGYDYYAGH